MGAEKDIKADDKEKEIKAYLGDGVYAKFDGWMIELNGNANGRDNKIYLEPNVYDALVKFAKHCKVDVIR